jgi:hypothetical protein
VCDIKQRQRQRLFSTTDNTDNTDITDLDTATTTATATANVNGICYGFSRMVMSSGLMAWKGDTAFGTEVNYLQGEKPLAFISRYP